jgi:hypothetical protein
MHKVTFGQWEDLCPLAAGAYALTMMKKGMFTDGAFPSSRWK